MAKVLKHCGRKAPHSSHDHVYIGDTTTYWCNGVRIN